MKQIIQHLKNGQMELANVPPPTVGAKEVLVSTQASLISAGTEKMLIDFAGKSLVGKAKERPDLVKKALQKVQKDGVMATLNSVLSRLDEPLPLGYSAAGTVVAVGKALSGQYRKGDRVVMAGASAANHAEVNAVPANLLAKLPDNVSFEEGSFATLTAIAMHGVRNAKPQLGDRVLVMGLGLVGQLASQLLLAAGCQVTAFDFDKKRLQLAEKFGVTSFDLSRKGADQFVQEVTDGRGFDSILICAATESNTPLEQAAVWARDRARVVMVGKVGTTVPYADYMKKEIELVISRSYGPGRYDPAFEQAGMAYPVGYVPWTEQDNLAEAVRLMAAGKLDVTALITHQFPIDEALQAYDMVTNGTEPHMGVILQYPQKDKERLIPYVQNAHKPVSNKKIGLSFIGAGAFTRSVLGPALASTTQAVHRGVVSKGGLSAQTFAKKYEFAFATSDIKDIWQDKSTHAVVITTRHADHAIQVEAALKAGKHVLVEKPLAMNKQELAQVAKAQAKSGTVLMVGFNRRFAPATIALQKKLASITGPKQVLIRVNAGQLESGNWQTDPNIGGGRLVGEVCHFTDLAYALVGQTPIAIAAEAGAGQDNYSISITFTDGSLATILYTSDGDSSAPKEYIEVHGGGSMGTIENFRQATWRQDGRLTKIYRQSLWQAQDKGHAQELEEFCQACQAGAASVTTAEYLMSSQLPLLAQESIQMGGQPRPISA